MTMKQSARKFFIYARKSTEEASRQVRSIPDQLVQLRDLARKEGITVIAELTESQTAKAPGRPVFNNMLDRIERGEAAGVLAWHPDRLSRNGVDGGRVMHLIDTGSITDLKFCTFWFEPTPQGKFMLAIAFGQSKYYVDNLSENIRRGKRQKLKDGLWPQFAPLGYINDRITRGITLDPIRAPLVRSAFELYAAGDCTLDHLTATMNRLGLTSRNNKPLSRAQFFRFLRNPIYHGLIRYREELHEGKHEPIISKSLFDQVQLTIRRRAKCKERLLKPYVFRKMFQCGTCGCCITTETQKGHHYLHCTKKKGACSEPYVREELIVSQLDAALASIAVPEAWLNEMETELAAERTESGKTRESHVAALERAIARTDAKLARLTSAYLEEALSLSEYRDMKNKLLEGKARCLEEKSNYERQDDNRLEPIERFIKRLREASLLASSERSAEKAKFLGSTGSNLTIQNRKLNCTFERPWKIIENHGRFAQSPTAAPVPGAAARGELDKIFTAAERGRFELP